MTFARIHGLDDLVSALVRMVDSDRIPHAIMLHEDDGGAGMQIALAFLQYIYCTGRHDSDSCGSCPSCNRVSKLIHPDVHFIFPTVAQRSCTSLMDRWRELVLGNPNFTESALYDALGAEGKSSLIAVSEAKALLDTLSLNALEGHWRSVVTYLPEKMNQEAANRLLKLIEEPPSKTLFIFITHAPEKVLSTILSRCQQIRLRANGVEEAPSGSEDTVARVFSSLMDSLVSRDLVSALDACEAAAALPSRESAKAFCSYASEKMREIFLFQQGLTSLCVVDEPTQRWARSCRRSFPRLALEVLDRAAYYITRNVNVKIIFTSLGGKLYRLI